MTVVSPPDSSTTGRENGRPVSEISAAIAACILAISLASPSIWSEIMTAGIPISLAHSAAAASDFLAEATITTSSRANAGSWGCGASESSVSNHCARRGFKEMPQTLIKLRTSSRDVVLGIVGPEATWAGSSPGTSETTMVTTLAGWATWASRPPLIALNCPRTAFITEMGAPECSKEVLRSISSSSVRSPSGIGNSADPPPQIRATTRSSTVRFCRASMIWWDASSPT